MKFQIKRCDRFVIKIRYPFESVTKISEYKYHCEILEHKYAFFDRKYAYFYYNQQKIICPNYKKKIIHRNCVERNCIQRNLEGYIMLRNAS